MMMIVNHCRARLSRFVFLASILGLTATLGCVDRVASWDSPDCELNASMLGSEGLVAADYWDLAVSLVIDEGQLLVHRRETGFSNSPSDLDVFSIHPGTSREAQLTANDWDDIILDAAEGAMLISSADPESGEYTLVFRKDGSDTILMRDSVRRFGSYATGRKRMVNAGAAAWFHEGAVYLYAGGEVVSVSEGVSPEGSVDLVGDTVVFSAGDGTGWALYQSSPSIIAAESEDRRQLTFDDSYNRYPMMAGERVYWLSNNRAMSLDLDTLEPRVLDEGPCTFLTADEQTALFMCREPRMNSETWPNSTTRILVDDGNGVVEVFSDRNEIHTAAIDADAIAWIEYGGEFDGMFVEGTVFYASIREDVEPLDIATVGSGCWSCGMLWPDAQVIMEDGILAWNYAMESGAEDEGSAVSSVGYRVVGQSLECAP